MLKKVFWLVLCLLILGCSKNEVDMNGVLNEKPIQDKDKVDPPLYLGSSSALLRAQDKQAEAERLKSEARGFKDEYNLSYLFTTDEDAVAIGKRAENNTELKNYLKMAKKMDVKIYLCFHHFSVGEGCVFMDIRVSDKEIIDFLRGICGGCA